MRRCAAHVLGVAALATSTLSGCGSDPGGATEAPPSTTVSSPPPIERLTPVERRLLGAYDRRISAHCVRVSRSLVNPERGPNAAQRRRAFAAAEKLVALAAEKPSAPLGAGQDTRLFLADVVENLEGSNCDPQIAAVLERGLAGIPLE